MAAYKLGKNFHQSYIWQMDNIQNLQRIQEVRHQQPNIPIKMRYRIKQNPQQKNLKWLWSTELWSNYWGESFITVHEIGCDGNPEMTYLKGTEEVDVMFFGKLPHLSSSAQQESERNMSLISKLMSKI